MKRAHLLALLLLTAALPACDVDDAAQTADAEGTAMPDADLPPDAAEEAPPPDAPDAATTPDAGPPTPPIDDDPPLAEDGHPEGWTDETHGKGADPAWHTLFTLDRVHRIDIAMPAETYDAMLADLEELLGAAGSGGGGPPGGGGGPPGGGGRPQPPQAGFDACLGLDVGAACSFEDAGNTIMGTCQNVPFGDGLFCALNPPGGGGPQPPGDGGGPVDLTGGDPMWVPVTVRHDGRPWYHVGMRFKGNSSLSSTWRSGGRKMGFRLTFDKYEDDFPEVSNQRFHGFKKMTFAPGFGDASMVRDIIAGEMLRDMGIPAALAAFYEVYVDTGNGPVFWGLYTMIEDPSDQLIEAWFEDDGGNLYKPEGTGADWTRFDPSGFEKKNNEDDADWSDVEAAITALNADRADAAAWRAGLEATFDVDGFLRWLAANTVIANWDAYGQMAHN
ncbi:MAG: CotH kinase family protein, partial [Myxococcales bacterium]|nr:CotH kinase family protein [Myxococcales bacterium]